MKSGSMRRASGLVVLALAFGSAAYAQEVPKAEFSGGYQLIGLKSDVDETLEKGWYAELAGNFGRHFAAVFHVGGNYKTFEERTTIGGVTGTATVDLKVHEFLGGVRLSARPSTVVTPFAHVLVGAVNSSADAEGSVTSGGTTLVSISNSDSSTDFGLAIGGGATIWVKERVGIRGMADYIRVFDADADVNAFRVAGGVVFGF